MSGSNKITMESVISQRKEQLSTDIDGEVVLMTIEQGNYYGMNKSLSSVWGLIDKPISVSDICDKLMENFEVEKDECKKDVIEVLNQLAEEELIEVQ